MSESYACVPGPRTSGRFLLVAVIAVVLVAAGCPARRPPGNVTGFTARAGDGQVELTWRNPAGGSFAGVNLRRSTEGYPSTPAQGDSVYEGSGERHTDTGLQNGTTYYYTIFTRGAGGSHSRGVQAVARPVSSSADPDTLETFEYLEGVLDALPEEVLAPEQLDEFSDLLKRADLAYRAGEPCEAADWLHLAMDLSQDIRAGSRGIDTMEAAELLYNTGRNIRYQILSGPANDTCPGAERFALTVAVEFDEAAADSTRADTRVRFGEPRLATLWEDGQLYTRLLVPDAEAQVEEGCPGVPMTRTLLAVPAGASVEVSSTPVEAETVRMRLLPARNPLVESLEERDPFDQRPFVMNDAVYALDAPYPAAPARVIELGNYRDLRLVVLEVAGGQYNPVQEMLTLFSEVDVRVAFHGGTGSFLTEAALNPFESPGGLHHAALNRTAIWENLQARMPDFEWLGEELLILTHPDFRRWVDELAEWRNETGTMARVFEVGEGTDRPTADSIREFIRQRYMNTLVRPSYVLLVGDVEFIPTFHTERILRVEPGEVKYIATDMPYGIMATYPDLTDRVPDLAVGRITADHSNHVLNYVNKVIAYESAPPDDSIFYQQAAIAGQFQCCRNNVDWIDRGTNQMWFLKPAEFAHRVITGAGYGVDRIYVETVDEGNPDADPPRPPYTGDPTPRKFWDFTPLPIAIGPGSGFNWDQGTDEILEAWGEGRFLFIHSDHGAPWGWGHPRLTSHHMGSLPQNNRLPFVFSMNCSSGYYDNEVDRPDEPFSRQYFVDKLLFTIRAGAIGVIAASRETGSYENGVLLKGLVDAPFPNALSFGGTAPVRRLGDILNHGRLYLLTQIGTHPWINDASVADETQLYNAFGDPTVAMWVDSPHNLELPPLEEVLVQPNRFVVPYPVERTVLTAWQDLPDQGLVPVGRGTVQGGEASIQLVTGYSTLEPIRLSAIHPEALPRSFSFDAVTGNVSVVTYGLDGKAVSE